MGWRRRKTNTPVKVTATTTVVPTITNITVTESIPQSIIHKRGEWMGISAGPFAPLRVLDATKDLGLGWVRVSHELGWNSLSGLKQTVPTLTLAG